MSVPIRNRSKSEIDYHYDAVMVDQSIIQLVLRKFGGRTINGSSFWF